VSDSPVTPLPDDNHVRRKDLVELGDTFKTALAPVSTLVTHIKEQNENSVELLNRMDAQARRTDRLQRWMFVNTAVALAAITILVVVIFSVRQVVGQVDSTARELREVAASVNSARESAEETKEKVAEVSSAQAAQSRVELVPETDPEKAEEAPVLVRIVAPSRPPNVRASVGGASQKAAEGPEQVVEVPIPKESLKGDPAQH
jgi:ABC-type transport system involved in cytochrome bd biosynthesis fused ATPase/permease subunit